MDLIGVVYCYVGIYGVMYVIRDIHIRKFPKKLRTMRPGQNLLEVLQKLKKPVFSTKSRS